MPRKKPQPKKRAAKRPPAEQAKATDPNKLTVDELADLLKRAGAVHVDAAKIAADIANGVPTNKGTVSLLHYAGWLVKQLTK